MMFNVVYNVFKNSRHVTNLQLPYFTIAWLSFTSTTKWTKLGPVLLLLFLCVCVLFLGGRVFVVQV